VHIEGFKNSSIDVSYADIIVGKGRKTEGALVGRKKDLEVV